MMPTKSPCRESVDRPPVQPSDSLMNNEPWTNQRTSAQAGRAARAAWSGARRRFVDPTTCDREYADAELEFMQAMQRYKQRSGRNFPTWSEVLEVLVSLGYRKVATTE